MYPPQASSMACGASGLRKVGAPLALEGRTPPKIASLLQISAMAKASAPPSASPMLPEPVSYEAALTELEALLSQVESGQLPLEKLLTGYQRGAALLAFCRERLEAVEQQVRVLDEGVLKPWMGNS